MGAIWRGLVQAIELIVRLDPEVVEISWRSLRISATATLIGAALCIPMGSIIHFNRFRGKAALVNLIQTLYSVPTVVIGLLVYIFFSHAGPFGAIDLLFSPTIMIIGEVLLIIPLLTGLIVSALSGVDRAITDTALGLGASRLQMVVTVIKEARFGVMATVILGFGRAISEVGLALMVGGNIYGYTRVLTTAISLEVGKGNIELSIALGIILLLIALIVNIILNRIQRGKSVIY
ncbi:MAG: ABC transporter permease [Chloroflexota bacterium]